MSRDEIAASVARYAEVVKAPVALATAVERLTPTDDTGWQHSQASASLVGPQLDGPYLAEIVARHASRPGKRSALTR
jgi:hypothetical protein